MYLPTDKIKKYIILDVEGDGLPSKQLWCVATIDVATGEENLFTDLREATLYLQAKKREGFKFVGHNIIGYDAPTLNRLLKVGLTISDLVDTMVLSMVYSPSFDGGHSLENWGLKLRMPKGDHSDFSRYTEAMGKYCLQDTRICKEIFLRITKRMLALGFTEIGLEIEHRAWYLIQKQMQNGFAFDRVSAEVLYGTIRQKENELQEEIYKYWPPQLEVVGTFKRPFKKDGSPSANYERHQQQYPVVRLKNSSPEYECLDYVYFNIGSPKQRIDKLLSLGWKPLEFTKPSKTHPNGQPKATDKGQLVPSLLDFVEKSGKEEVRLIAQWIEYNSRANMINTWLEAYNEDTGCIHGSLWLANTLRYRHSNPNSANIPAVRKDKDKKPLLREAGVYTYEARALWTTRDPSSRCLVGVDAKGIQLRVLAHYLNNPEFTDVVINGDPHSYNQEIGEFESRDLAKTFIYAFFLGAGDAKVGSLIRGSAKDGRDLKARFVERTPGLKRLLNDLKGQVKRTGRIRLVDGTPVIVDRIHTVLAYLLQGDESRIMKKAAILIDEEIRRRKLDVLKVGDIHDEFQFDVAKENVTEFRKVCEECFIRAGKFFNYSVPIDCDSKVGLTWAETH
jgi:DNA polymerase-1